MSPENTCGHVTVCFCPSFVRVFGCRGVTDTFLLLLQNKERGLSGPTAEDLSSCMLNQVCLCQLAGVTFPPFPRVTVGFCLRLQDAPISVFCLSRELSTEERWVCPTLIQ